MTLQENLRLVATQQSARTALVCEGRQITYEALYRTAAAVGRQFLAWDLKAGDRVAIQWYNTIEAAELILACYLTGLVAVPVNTRFKPAETAYVLGHAQPKRFFVHPAFAPQAHAAVAESGLPIVLLTEVPHGLPGPDLVPPDPDAPIEILYTSGTTARPKGVTHTSATVLAMARSLWPTGIRCGTTILIMLPLMHVGGLNAALVPALTCGATAVLIPTFDPAVVLDAIQAHHVEWLLGLPALLQFVLVEQEQRPREVGSLRDALAGGDAVPLTLQERFRNSFAAPLREGYAMSESMTITCNAIDDNRPGTMGRPPLNVQVEVRDFDGRPLPVGEIGEITVRSPATFVGYWNDPAETRAALVEGWLRTGDLGHFDADGCLWFAGRRKELIIRAGSNISPQEVEEALYLHPAVLEAGVVGLPDAVLGERVAAAVALREGHSVEPTALQSFVRERIADYKVPETVLVLRQLPKGLTGKVQRRAIKELLVASTRPG